MGACASTGGIFDTYAMTQGIDTVVPVDVYVPGCPPRPEGLLYGILLLHKKIRGETSAEQKTRVPDSVHPVVRTHPENGRKCLYVNEGFTIGICGVPEEEGRALLKELFGHIKKPEFMYRHRWQPNDVVIWDNVQTQHCAVGDYDLPLVRTMHRTAVTGSVPF